MMLVVDSHNGIYCPQAFVERFVDTFTDEQLKEYAECIESLLSGPENAQYWESWETLTNENFLVTIDGTKYFIYHDNDVWLVPENYIWNEAKEIYEHPDEVEESV